MVPIDATFETHGYHIGGVKIGESGKNIVSWSIDELVRIWDIVTGKLLEEPRKYPSMVEEILASFFENYILVRCADASIWIFEVKTNNNLGTRLSFQVPNEKIQQVRFSSSDRWLLVVTEKRLDYWDVRNNFKLVYVFENGDELLKDAIFSNHERYLVFWNEHRFATVLDLVDQSKMGQSLYS